MTAFPEDVTSALVLTLQPEDVLVVSVSEPVRQAQMDRVGADIRRVVGHDRVLVLGPGISLSVLRHETGTGAEVAAELRTMLKDLAP